MELFLLFICPSLLLLITFIWNLLLLDKVDKLENEKILLIKEIDRLDKKIYGGNYGY